MNAVAIMALVCCVAFRLSEEEQMVLLFFSPPCLFLSICGFLVFHYRHL